ncbi:MAG TPA: Tar ligand binding domain-containing protein [Novimethylophilus sp.]|jgi:PAS domain S-box-containing protein|uniref:Tar ligand binding domain-containing protein n=1 Tax=Novimethylophilus sp. TaxID=2137426 RepID=UPI002F41357F
MKINLPVTGRENVIAPGRSLVSRTDIKGVITFTNDAFIEVSGYSRAELVGSSHNIVRHPDVPPAVFEDMWDTLHQGLPWRGVVKNRCKNGDHYWVDARVVPVRKNGATIGYMSVRGVPSREAIARAETAYAAIAKAGKVTTANRTGGWKRFISIKNGVLAGIVFVTLMMIAGGVLGISGLHLSSNAMRTLYHEEMEPVQTIGRINFLMAENRAQIALALRHRPAARTAWKPDPGVAEHMATLMRNRSEIETLWKDYNSRQRTGLERELSDRYWRARTRYVEDGLIPAKAALVRGDYDTAEKLLQDNVDPAYEEAKKTVEALLAFVSQKAKGNALSVAELNEKISIVAMGGIAFGSIAFMLAGLFFFRSTVIPLQAAVADLERIAEGNLSGDSDASGYGEPGRVTAALVVMQMHLKVMMDEIRLSAGAIHDQCSSLNRTMMNLSEHSEEQHDRVYQTLDNISESSTGLDRLAADAEELMLVTGLQSTDGVLHETAENAPPNATGGDLPNEAHLMQLIQELAGAARIEAFTLQDTIAQMRQVASLIVDSRGEVQGAWAASQQLERAALELDRLVKYFE